MDNWLNHNSAPGGARSVTLSRLRQTDKPLDYLPRFFYLRVIVGSWFKCNTDFLLEKQDDATSGPENNLQVLASSLISFSWKKYWHLAPKPSLNGLSISGDQNFLRQRWPKK